MFENMITSVLDSKMSPLKREGVKLTNVKYQNQDVVLATNLPANYKACFYTLLAELNGFGLKITDVLYKNLPAMIISDLPAQYKGAIQSYVRNNF